MTKKEMLFAKIVRILSRGYREMWIPHSYLFEPEETILLSPKDYATYNRAQRELQTIGESYYPDALVREDY